MCLKTVCQYVRNNKNFFFLSHEMWPFVEFSCLFMMVKILDELGGAACCITVKVAYLSRTPLLGIGFCFDILLELVLSTEITPNNHAAVSLPSSYITSCISMTHRVKKIWTKNVSLNHFKNTFYYFRRPSRQVAGSIFSIISLFYFFKSAMRKKSHFTFLNGPNRNYTLSKSEKYPF